MRPFHSSGNSRTKPVMPFATSSGGSSPPSVDRAGWVGSSWRSRSRTAPTPGRPAPTEALQVRRERRHRRQSPSPRVLARDLERLATRASPPAAPTCTRLRSPADPRYLSDHQGRAVSVMDHDVARSAADVGRERDLGRRPLGRLRGRTARPPTGPRRPRHRPPRASAARSFCSLERRDRGHPIGVREQAFDDAVGAKRRQADSRVTPRDIASRPRNTPNAGALSRDSTAIGGSFGIRSPSARSTAMKVRTT